MCFDIVAFPVAIYNTTFAPTRNVYIAFRMRCASKKLQMIEKNRTPHFETLAILRPFFVISF